MEKGFFFLLNDCPFPSPFTLSLCYSRIIFSFFLNDCEIIFKKTLVTSSDFFLKSFCIKNKLIR